ncbi:outer membrane protein/peptidoglycan-associated (lipo)protein [Oscillatoria acuminata PCC 6304]|uniref:Outer membrane protein/peptidoglycan-associated (Lipo)protein n=2 Tax=Oscillatoria acuminata TaxID=118323 RepID=K9TK88_9CYAN|nr:outer membrane protein/peptidoglycan-associated (lipo)protein [Oscillatoria acuminata PCC 6304]
MGVTRPSQPVTPSEVGGDKAQGKSEFNPRKNPVAQIYFPTNDSKLDSQDIGILFLLANALEGAEFVSLNFYGYADKREAVDYNLQLTDLRTASVSSRLLTLLDKQNVNDYEALDVPLSEIERPQNGTTAEELKPFRRVDIEIQQLKSHIPQVK